MSDCLFCAMRARRLMSSLFIVVFCLSSILSVHSRHTSSSKSRSIEYDNDIDNDSDYIDNDENDSVDRAEEYYTKLSVCYNDDTRLLYTVDGDKCEHRIAIGRFRNEINQTGWSYLEIETSGNFTPEMQAYAAGVAEGKLTRLLIYYHLKNTVEDKCKGYEEYCKRLYDYLTKNLDWIRSQVVKKPSTDLYWRQVNLTMTQLTGIIDGYENRPIRPKVSFDIHPILIIQISGELYDLDKVFEKKKNKTFDTDGKCSGFFKVAPGNKDLFFAQVAMEGLECMTRVLKLYKFGYDKKEVPGYAASFSGYPAQLVSADDFVQLSSGLGAVETTISIFNKTLYIPNKFVRPEKQLHCWLRTVVANQLASDARQWCKIFARYNSGTYNNQWTVVDYKKFTPNQPLPKRDLLWLLEQIPGKIIARDITWHLRKYTYFASYNIPYFKKISKISGFDDRVKEYGNWYRWGHTPRANIFRRDHHKVVDIESLTALMRYNDYQHDEFSRCNCTPPYTAEAGISARGDLNPVNGTFQTGMAGGNHAGVDMKCTNVTLFKQLRFRAWGGPTYDPLPVFSWSNSYLREKVRHFGQPDTWNFTFVEPIWEAKVKVDGM
jgi:hypothetical protein